MSSTFKIILAIFLLIGLSGCSAFSTNIKVTSKPKPELVIPQIERPLENLAPVNFRVIIIDGNSMYVLDEKNYSNLSNNMEKIQSRLNLYHNSIKEYKEYYSSESSTK